MSEGRMKDLREKYIQKKLLLENIEYKLLTFFVSLLIIFTANDLLVSTTDVYNYLIGNYLLFYGFTLWTIMLFYLIVLLSRMVLISNIKGQYLILIHYFLFISFGLFLWKILDSYKVFIFGIQAMILNLDYTIQKAYYLLLKLYPESLLTPFYGLLLLMKNQFPYIQKINAFIIDFQKLTFVLAVLTIMHIIYLFLNKKSNTKLDITILFSFIFMSGYLIYIKSTGFLYGHDEQITIFIYQNVLLIFLVLQVLSFYNYIREKAIKKSEQNQALLLFGSMGFIWLFVFIIPMYANFEMHYEKQMQVVKILQKREDSFPTMIVKAQALNVRQGPSLEFIKLYTLKENQKVKAYEEKNGWVRVDTDGWVSKKYLK